MSHREPSRFKIVLSDSYPVWFEIVYDGKTVAKGVSHRQLRGLETAVQQAIIDATARLGESFKHEME